VTWWRLATAARMLRDSDARVGEVAPKIGYRSEFAFSNAFKREYGVAPGRYRRQTCDKVAAQANQVGKTG
jgi:AraC-like DNA-binding protein